jgi:predicted NBD/HSP70 family sugar kinase
VVFLKASTGLGAGLVVDGDLVRGSRGAAGELGHTRTPAADDLRCRCGETGCLEAVAGGWALVRDLDGHGHRVEHLRELVALALDGDPDARSLVRRSGRAVGTVLAGVVNLLNPEAIVVGGDMAPVYERFVAGLRETLYAGATGVATRDLQILPTSHGEQSGLIGCAEAALEAVLSPPAVDRMLSG